MWYVFCLLPLPTIFWILVSCRKVMVIPLLLLSSEDNLRMNCPPVCLSNVFGLGLRRQLWSGFLQVKRCSLSLPGLPGIIIVVKLSSVYLSYPATLKDL